MKESNNERANLMYLAFSSNLVFSIIIFKILELVINSSLVPTQQERIIPSERSHIEEDIVRHEVSSKNETYKGLRTSTFFMVHVFSKHFA